MLDREIKLAELRLVITENLRIQRGGAKSVPYVDVANALGNMTARQNHVVFGRRGCGKSLLLQESEKQLDASVKCVYLNCEDFKKHTFPNVLIQILGALFYELENNLSGWFGRKKKSKELIRNIINKLTSLEKQADKQETGIRESESAEREDIVRTSVAGSAMGISASGEIEQNRKRQAGIEKIYQIQDDKIRELDMWLPVLKQQIREFFSISGNVRAIFIQFDDFYHLNRLDQPYTMDYIHRLCKDLPLYFKLATLRHASVLYADRERQPIGAQERHDYQPINVDFTLAELRKTQDQNHKIFYEFGRLAGMDNSEIDSLFKGEGFQRLVLAGGGVPRDCLSLFLDILTDVDLSGGDSRIGKDDVRIFSRSNFERRIEELKQDSEGYQQDTLIRGIYVLRKFCIDKKTNVFMVSEQMMQQEDKIRDLVYRLLDYRIIHNAGVALTHKSQSGTYQAFAIDIGCYAHMRKLDGRLNEVDLSRPDAKERMRSTPILDKVEFDTLWKDVPDDPERVLLADDEDTE